MKIKERIYPYPVIKETDADYKDFQRATFDFSLEPLDEKGEQLRLTIHPDNVPEVLLPHEGNKISYGVQIESLTNKNRVFLSQQEPMFDIFLNGNDYIGRIEINAYIYAAADLDVDFDQLDGEVDSFYDGPVTYYKGSIIAVSRPTKVVEVSANGKDIENPVRVVKDDNMQESIRYDINTTQILIHINSTNYTIYSRYGRDRTLKDFITNAIVVPAISKALLVMRDNEEDYLEGQSPWANLFQNSLRNHGYEVSDVGGTAITLEAATQLVLNNPINKMFSKLKRYGENK